MKKFSDEEIIKGLKKRDNQILQYIYSHYYDSVRILVENNHGYDNDAEDIFQEALIVLFKQIRDDVKFELTSTFATYIYSVAKLLWLRKLRDGRKINVTELNNEMEESIELEDPPPFQDMDLRMAIYQRNLLKIPDDCQQILKMTAKDVKAKEIAEKLGFRSDVYVRKRRHFCKEFLINKIKEDSEYINMMDED